MHFWAIKKSREDAFWFCDVFIFQRQCIYFTVQLRMRSSKPGIGLSRFCSEKAKKVLRNMPKSCLKVAQN